jgi:hypothetical protein
MKDKLHIPYGLFVVLFTIYAFWGRAIFSGLSEGQWLVGLLAMVALGSVYLVIANVIEEAHDAPPAGDGHH